MLKLFSSLKGSARRLIDALARGGGSKNGLWGSGKGNYKKTVGKYGSATVRGTIWLTRDEPAGTFFQVKSGVVTVKELRRRQDAEASRRRQVSGYFALTFSVRLSGFDLFFARSTAVAVAL